MSLNLLNVKYLPAQKKYWTGRKSNPNIEKQYWHQEIKLLDIRNITIEKKINIALLGYVCDEGVRRNIGRVGAAEGPKVIRETLAKLPIHFNDKRVVDIGDIICVEKDMESCQQAFAKTISTLIANKIFPIAIGGGHDIAFGHFMGIREVVKNTTKNKVGIINFDAHFDLRPVEEQPNSGTPFNQIISELQKNGESVDYFAIGIQQQSNTKELFDIAKKKHVDFAVNYDCEAASEEIKVLQNRLIPFIKNNDYIYITIDMDGFSSAYAPGVSAPSPLGFTPYFVFKMLRFLLDTKKVISLDIAELNPSLDQDRQTANLAAKIIDFVVLNHKF
ncbi:formimidoylglutamase [uncultured Polaribacter sp.]|uniref:formimidoylglutamase n=1 Tax=uncultured Polaribacter sp. TaxID=174711 RepID=UPI00260A7F42|nr:formimidoylglutamase [uncultured Polaribacter sp.]